ncbi:MAG: Gfo/Idh/MocA family oxidoreductase [Pseudolabrys sp.]|nr:Gfo/Idh/MocA family oxidoreductase [Pseudolabrys sp.]
MASDNLPAGRTFLVVGSGSIGQRHLANLRRLAPQSRIVVLRRHTDGELAGADLVVHSIEQALAERPYAAIVANPAPMHVPVALELAGHGCHLLVEKPLSDGLAGVDALLRTCTERRVVLAVGYNLRFLPSLQRLAALLAEGAIGKILHLRAEVGQYLPDWRPKADYRQSVTAQRALGGGALLELSHEIDLALWLAGPATAASARIDRIGDLAIDTDDCVDLALDFASGARGSVHMDLLQRMPRRKILVAGSTGSLEWDYFADTLRIGRSAAEGWQEVDAPKQTDRNDMYVRELETFLDCTVTGASPPVDGAAARNVLAVIEAARRSQQNSQARIEIECQP